MPGTQGKKRRRSKFQGPKASCQQIIMVIYQIPVMLAEIIAKGVRLVIFLGGMVPQMPSRFHCENPSLNSNRAHHPHWSLPCSFVPPSRVRCVVLRIGQTRVQQFLSSCSNKTLESWSPPGLNLLFDSLVMYVFVFRSP